MLVWGNAGAMEMVRQANPDLAREIEGLGYVLRVHNMLHEAQELGLSVPCEAVDVETMHLVFLLRSKLREREEKRHDAKANPGGRRGR